VALVSVPTPQVDVSKAPQSEVSSAAFARPNIGAGLEALGQGAEQLTDSLAKQQAQSDAQSMGVTLAADGSVQVATPKNSILLGQAGEDYHRVLADQLYASQQANVSQGLTNIQLQHQDDPTAAKVAMDAFVGNLRQSATSQLGAVAGNALADRAMGEASQRWANLAEKSFELNTRMGLQSIETQIDSANNWLTAAARQGAVDTDAYREKQADLSDAYDRLGSNKLYGYSADRIQAMKDRAFDLLQGEYVAGQIDDTFNKKGKAAALEAVRTQIDNNPNLDISEPDRNHLHNIAMSRLAYLSDEQQSAIAALKPTVELQKQKLASGNSGADAVTDREIDQTATQLSSLGAFKEAQDLQAAHMIADRMQAFKNLSPDQKSTVLMGAASAGVGGPIASALNTEQAGLQYYISKGWTPAQAAGIMGNLIHESGGRLNPAAVNPGDGTDGSDSIGIGQWNGQRAANLKSFAAAQGKSWQDFGVQLAFVQHELETSEGAAGQRLKAAQSPQDAAAAFALGYERPQGFQSGDLSKVTRTDSIRRSGSLAAAHRPRRSAPAASPRSVGRSRMPRRRRTPGFCPSTALACSSTTRRRCALPKRNSRRSTTRSSSPARRAQRCCRRPPRRCRSRTGSPISSAAKRPSCARRSLAHRWAMQRGAARRRAPTCSRRRTSWPAPAIRSVCWSPRTSRPASTRARSSSRRTSSSTASAPSG
jgi:Phage tail lysozyme